MKPDPVGYFLVSAKVSDKIKLIENMLDKVNALIICGGMSFTFKKTLNNVAVSDYIFKHPTSIYIYIYIYTDPSSSQIGNSLFDQAGSELVAGLVQKAKDKNVKLVFPVDYVTADSFSKDAKTDYATDQDGIPDGWMGLDCGKESNKIFTDEILSAKTILWNGPTGVFEFEKFAEGTKEALKAVIEATKNGATSIIGGGGKSLLLNRESESEGLTAGSFFFFF